MVDVHTKKQRSYNMSMIKGKNTKPELSLRKLLSSKKIRGYKLNYKLPGKPDIVFGKYKLVIFIDGCFWHRCPKCFIKPATRAGYWTRKIEGNVKRDELINKELKNKNWSVLRLWEHQIKKDGFKVIEKLLSYTEAKL